MTWKKVLTVRGWVRAQMRGHTSVAPAARWRFSRLSMWQRPRRKRQVSAPAAPVLIVSRECQDCSFNQLATGSDITEALPQQSVLSLPLLTYSHSHTHTHTHTHTHKRTHVVWPGGFGGRVGRVTCSAFPISLGRSPGLGWGGVGRRRGGEGLCGWLGLGWGSSSERGDITQKHAHLRRGFSLPRAQTPPFSRARCSMLHIP